MLVAPGIQAQYMDEIIAGFEYELLDDLKVGVSFQNRRLGRVIEDVSTDGANTYIIANPGEFSAERGAEARGARSTARRQRRRTSRGSSTSSTLFQGIRIFDKPRRDYNALQFTLTAPVLARSCTSRAATRTRAPNGNYPGLISYDNGQIDPNISSQYDLIELLANHVGPLPQDRPHYIKLDGYYTFDLKKAGDAHRRHPVPRAVGHPRERARRSLPVRRRTSRSSCRAASSAAPTSSTASISTSGYGKTLNKNMKLELFCRHLQRLQPTRARSTSTTPTRRTTSCRRRASAGEQQNANPVSGGTYEDLIWVKEIDSNGIESAKPIGRNPNFHNTTGRYSPMSARLGVRLTF